MSRDSLLDFYREIVNSEKSFGIDYKNLSKQLIERIDKAIEYIKNYYFVDGIRIMDIDDKKALLKILGDKENE